MAITSPAPSAVLPTAAANTITAEAADDRGGAHVVFSAGERTLCVAVYGGNEIVGGIRAKRRTARPR